MNKLCYILLGIFCLNVLFTKVNGNEINYVSNEHENDDNDDDDDDDDDKIAKRIIGGYVAPENRYHWTVSLKGDIHKYRSSGICGASIINTNGRFSKWLLSAAHCFFAKAGGKRLNLTDPTLWHGRIGKRKVNYFYNRHQKRSSSFRDYLNNFLKNYFKKFKIEVPIEEKPVEENNYGDLHFEKIIVHPKYKPGILEYDIAIMKLKRPIDVKRRENVNNILLPPSSLSKSWPHKGQRCIVVGWGCTKAGGRASQIAKLAILKAWDNQDCIKTFKSRINLNKDHELCAGYYGKRYGLCPGDSGSGLACFYRGKVYIAGIVSAVHSRLPGQYPAIFTRVTFFEPWIKSVMKRY